MSTEPGDEQLAADLLAQSKALVEQAAAEEAQLALLDPLDAEDMALAQAELGPEAGTLAVLQHAREARAKGGRRPGVRNRRTDDFRRYLLSFGQDPAVTLMQIQTTQPEILMERSSKLDFMKRRMSYGDAQALRVRCAEALLPYVHSKQPIAIDGTIRGVIVHEVIGELRGDGENPNIFEGEIMGVMAPDEEGDS